MLEKDGPALVAELHEKSAYMRKSLGELGFDLGKSDTHIMPAMVRDFRKALYMHVSMLQEGVMMVPITYPGVKFGDDRPSFYLLNIGETHYPYAKPDEDSSMWPRISGVNGVFKKLDQNVDAEGKLVKDDLQFFDQDKLDQLRERQIDTVRYLDDVFEELYDMVPKNTYIIVTADHGELFGEMGYFGHGPIMHEKCFEVPYLEGKVR
jgi:hypothetical protein